MSITRNRVTRSYRHYTRCTHKVPQHQHYIAFASTQKDLVAHKELLGIDVGPCNRPGPDEKRALLLVLDRRFAGGLISLDVWKTRLRDLSNDVVGLMD